MDNCRRSWIQSILNNRKLLSLLIYVYNFDFLLNKKIFPTFLNIISSDISWVMSLIKIDEDFANLILDTTLTI